MDINNNASVIADEFLTEVDKIYNAYCANICAINLGRHFIEDKLKLDPTLSKKLIGLSTDSMKSQNHFLYTFETMGELYVGPTDEGLQQYIQSKVIIVMLYELWEREYRTRFAKAFNTENNSIQSNVFGDLRLFRNCIIHHRSIWEEQDQNQLRVLPLQNIGEELAIGFIGMMYILQLIRKSINEIKLNRLEQIQVDQEVFQLDFYPSKTIPWMVVSYPEKHMIKTQEDKDTEKV